MNVFRTIITLSLLSLTAVVKAQNLPYTNQTEAGLLAGTGSEPVFTAQTFNGIRISKWNLETGITTGADIYPQMTIVPVSAGFRWNPFNARIISPLFSLNAGYGFGWLERNRDGTKYKGGYILNPSLGLRVKTQSSAKVNVGVGYRQQKAVIRQNPDFYILDSFGGWPSQQKDEYKFRRMSLYLGLSF
jgi:hypothetical protein